MKTFKTKKGTELPLISLKGKDYLQVAHRLILLTEEHAKYTIKTEFLVITDEQTVAKATVDLIAEDGKIIRSASATKRETKKDFSDHTEKAETSAVGRALAMLGMGTQHAIADMEEGTRLADSPVVDPTPAKTSAAAPKTESSPVANLSAPAGASFRKPAKKVEPVAASADSWE